MSFIAQGVNIVGSRPRSLTPTVDAATIQFRYDASNHASLGSPSDGGVIATWNDLSSNAAHLTADSGTNRPTYRATGKNGKPVVEFATNDGLHNSGVSIAVGDMAYILVGYMDMVASANFRAWFAYYDGSERYFGSDSADQDYIFRIQDNTSGHTDAMVVHATRLDATKRFYSRNGVEQSFTQLAYAAGGTVTHLAMGGRINASAFLTFVESAWIAEIVGFKSSDVSEAQLITMSNELKTKWGIS